MNLYFAEEWYVCYAKLHCFGCSNTRELNSFHKFLLLQGKQSQELQVVKATSILDFISKQTKGRDSHPALSTHILILWPLWAPSVNVKWNKCCECPPQWLLVATSALWGETEGPRLFQHLSQQRLNLTTDPRGHKGSSDWAGGARLLRALCSKRTKNTEVETRGSD